MNVATSAQAGAYITVYNTGSFPFRVLAQDGSTVIYGSAISTTTISSAGSLYTDGTYIDVALTGGSGTGARATITIASGGVTSADLTACGTGYAVSDLLSVSAVNIGGTGSGFVLSVASLKGLPAGASLSVVPTSNTSANGTFNTSVNGDVLSSNNGSDFENKNTTLNNILPKQTGMSGKVLETDGSNASWQTIVAVPTGMIAMFPVTTAPTGYLELAGALVSRTTYAALWVFAQASGNLAASDAAWDKGQFSPGDGATTFRLPDFRDYVPRGAGLTRTLGTSQADAIKSHSVTVAITDPGHVHGNVPYKTTAQQGSNTGGALAIDNIGQTALAYSNITASGSYAGATETRMMNIAVMFCIKA